MKPLTLEQIKAVGRVAVLMGGDSAEKDISINSGMAVFKALQRLAVNVVAIDVKNNPISALTGKNIDRVFNVIHGRGGEDGVLQAILEVMKIPYTGSGVMASALSLDKLRTKLCWRGQGLPTPSWFLLKVPEDIVSCTQTLGFPVIVKPALEGSSIGMSKANNQQELNQAWLVASKYQCDVYAEAWVQGKEYTVAIIDHQVLPVIRLETPHTFYDFEAKYHSDNTQYHCPCGLSVQQEDQLKKLALEAYHCIGVKGWGRVDLFIDDSGSIQLIEVNTVPGMTDHSLVPMAAKASGMEFDELVWQILITSVNE